MTDDLYNYDDWDGLGICPVCGDVETLGGRLCRSCAEQEMIDREVPLQQQPDIDINDIFCLNCHAAYSPDDGEFTAFGGWFCGDCTD